MKKTVTREFVLVFVLLLALNMNAQQYDETIAVQSIALVNQDVSLNTPFSPFGNPALMPGNKKTCIGISVINKFFLPNLKQGGLGFTHKFSGTDVLGMALQFDGSANLKQNTIALAYAKKINEKFNAGISIIYLNTFEQTMGSKNNILGKAGIMFQPTRSFLIGVSVYNPFATKLSVLTKERIPTYFTAGTCYKLSKQVRVYAEYKLGMKDVHTLKLGLSYEPKPGIIVYAGYRNANAPLSFGFTFKSKNININIASQYHQVLGFTPAAGFDYEKD